MKKVLVFGIRGELGGVETIIMNYYRFFDKKKIHLDFLSIDEKMAFEDEIIKMGSKVFKICPKANNYFKNRKEMTDFFERHAKEYDSIWVNLSNLANIDYLKYAKKYGIKKRIIHCHSSQTDCSFVTKFFHGINKRLLKKYATDFWSCSLEGSKWFYTDDIIKSDNYKIINNAIDYDKFKYDSKVRDKYRKEKKIDDKLVFCHVGRLCYTKNQEFIIDIFNYVIKKEKDSCLLLVGDGPDREKLELKVEDLGLKDKVIFMGLQKDVSNILNASDIFLFPSIYEGLALSLVEAQSSLLPIFTSNNVSIESKMSDYFYQFSLEEDSKKWANNIIEKYKNIPERSKRKNNVVENGFDIKSEANKIQEYL